MILHSKHGSLKRPTGDVSAGEPNERTMKRIRAPLALLAAFSCCTLTAHAVITTVIVTPGSMQGWTSTDNRGGGTANVTNAHPYSVNGSLQMTLSGPSTDKANKVKLWDATNAAGNGFGAVTTFGNLQQYTFSWLRDSDSTVAGHFAPAARMYFANDTNNNGTIDIGDQRGSLVYEWAYNSGGAAPTDSWITTDVTEANLWMRTTVNLDIAGGWLTVAEWMDPNVAKPVGAFAINADTWLYGLEFSLGSGWAGTADMAVDKAALSFTSDGAQDGKVITNFEFLGPPVVPEPTSVAMIIGTLSLGLMRRRRR